MKSWDLEMGDGGCESWIVEIKTKSSPVAIHKFPQDSDFVHSWGVVDVCIGAVEAVPSVIFFKSMTEIHSLGRTSNMMRYRQVDVALDVSEYYCLSTIEQ